MRTPNYLKKVREQYENFPYPERDPKDELHRLIATETDCLDKLNYYCFEGKKNYRDNFRVLIAGGGTGDSAIFLAEQLRDFNADILYIDITENSMRIARERATVRGLTNIQWYNSSLLDIDQLDIGKFDYINCSGVLHHLADPVAGLSSLAAALKDDGAMSIMVYAQYGREGIYQIQELMRRINKDEPDMDKCVSNCRKVLHSLPETHILNHTRKLYPEWNYEESIELYDLFLHTQDRAYTVPELYEYVDSSDLKILHFLPGADPLGNRKYCPESYTDDKDLLGYMDSMSTMEKQSVAELLNGLIAKHTFYVARSEKKPASISEKNAIPYLNMHENFDSYKMLYHFICNSNGYIKLEKPNSHLKINFVKTNLTEHIFKYIDGNRSLVEIFSLIERDKDAPTVSYEIFQNEFENIFNAMIVHDFMYVRSAESTPTPTVQQIRARNSKSAR